MNGPIDPDGETTLISQVVALIEQDIRSGVLAKGQWLPSLQELATRSDISKGTIEQAYSALKASKRIARRRATGHFVLGADPRREDRDTDKAAWLDKRFPLPVKR